VLLFFQETKRPSKDITEREPMHAEARYTWKIAETDKMEKTFVACPAIQKGI
jgi:hypothetical protein